MISVGFFWFVLILTSSPFIKLAGRKASEGSSFVLRAVTSFVTKYLANNLLKWLPSFMSSLISWV
ncbi:unnamed protein product [Meloidogyne enterolobii]|uniref:Uncharacterized protein n=1 Tax=Meloidogyne enterolobii TaxID=390850 RepID=A0ACB0ZMJ2_MELEN